MSNQPEALYLADVIEHDPQSKAHHDAAAACLRRQHADIERLYAQRSSAVEDYEKAPDWSLLEATQESLREHMAEIHRLRAERDALRADAERYRWLRSTRDEEFWLCHEKDGYGGQILMYGVDLDAAIDAAREEKRDE